MSEYVCDNKECTIRKKCHRFTENPMKNLQEVRTFRQKKDGKCGNFWNRNSESNYYVGNPDNR